MIDDEKRLTTGELAHKIAHKCDIVAAVVTGWLEQYEQGLVVLVNIDPADPVAIAKAQAKLQILQACALELVEAVNKETDYD